MKPDIKLGKVFGVEIGLHYSWLIIALLIAFSVAANFRAANPGWSAGVVWGSAVITAILFFVALIAHELSHAIVAKSRGLPVRSITLFALGGVASIEKEPGDAKTEFWMGIVGPITSAAIGALCLALARLAGWEYRIIPDSPGIAMLVWLGYINLVLAAFNMIPGFPLDGGRVLRAIAWWTTGDPDRSLRIATQVGRVVAVLFIVFGILQFFSGAGFGGLWLAFIGWFLLEAARATYVQKRFLEDLRGVRVEQLMTRDCTTVDSSVSVQAFVDDYVLPTGRRCFMVAENGRTVGLITPRDLKEVPRDRWSATSLREAMRPLDRVRTVTPDAPVSDVLETMGKEDINQIPVEKDGRLEGIISRGQVLGFLQTREELKGI